MSKWTKLKADEFRINPTGPYRRMRAKCKDGCYTDIGFIEVSGNQKVMRCSVCGAAQYNAPLTELGERERTNETIRHIPMSQKRRIFKLAGGACEVCGDTYHPLQIGHMVSVYEGKDELTDHDLNADDNVAALCPACNGFQGSGSMPIELRTKILKRRLLRLSE